MNGAHWHLMLNHMPIIIPLAALIVLLYSVFNNKLEYSRAAYLLFMVGAVTTLPAFLTGEGAEETVEAIAGIDEKLIHTHEEAAETFAFVNYALGFLALIAFWMSYYKVNLEKAMKLVVLAAALLSLYFAKAAGTTGGEIRHTEIRAANSATMPVQSQEAEDDD